MIGLFILLPICVETNNFIPLLVYLGIVLSVWFVWGILNRKGLLE